ncbi:translation initiation factor Sui1 [Deltaproteobacteria bacterium TL4]
MKQDAGLVYSTEQGRMCPHCEKPKAQCRGPSPQAVPETDGIVRIRFETKGRKGKGMTTLSGIPLDLSPLNALAKQLKKKCGSGGSVKEGVIEIQGDHRELCLEELKKQGYSPKLAGG